MQLLNFFSKNRVGVLFVFLQFISFVFIIRSHSFHYSKYLSTANGISGSVYQKRNNIHSYFGLKQQNRKLHKENILLRNKIESLTNSKNKKQPISLDSISKYSHIGARVINNPYTKRNNILTIDKGEKDGIKPGMGVVVADGIIGITLKVSKNFSTILSLLNSRSSINAKMKKSQHYGSIQWDGMDYKFAHLKDIPIQTDIQINDTIVSGGKSIFFPEGIPIGTVKDFAIENKGYTSIEIQFFTDFSALNEVYVIQNRQKDEQLDIELESKNE